LYIDEFLCIIF